MKVRLPIYGKILLWFFLSIVVILGVLLFLFKLHLHTSSDSPLADMIGNRMQDVGQRICDELEQTDPAGWDAVLARHDDARQVTFTLFTTTGTKLAGKAIDLPPEIAALLARRGSGSREFLPPPAAGRGPDVGAPPRPADPPPPFDPRNPRLPGPPGPHPGGGPGGNHGAPPWMHESIPMDFAIHTGDPDLYWAGMALPVRSPTDGHMMPTILLVSSDSMSGHGLFFDATPWAIILFVVALVALLVWVPLVRNLTHPLRDMAEAASRISQGRFDIKLDDRRGDEIGALAACINDMAGRLDLLVNGQKRFLGDVAHELASPVARIQLAVGILQNARTPVEPSRLEDLRQEVQQLADLVNELLSFSRAEANPARIRLEPVRVEDVVQRAIRREGKGSSEVRVDVAPGLSVLADPELLARALANVLRNAVRYAGYAGAIDIVAWAEGDEVRIEVRDQGPGVPSDHVGQIFEPFYRVDSSRTRECGGVGLGLAIVKTCVMACQGTVTAANRKPSGFIVSIALARTDIAAAPRA